jgi:hypothetical protein
MQHVRRGPPARMDSKQASKQAGLLLKRPAMSLLPPPKPRKVLADMRTASVVLDKVSAACCRCDHSVWTGPHVPGSLGCVGG